MSRARGGIRDALLLAVGTLTAIPVPPPRVVDSRVAGRAMLIAPAVVLPVTAVAALAGWGLRTVGLPSLVAGLVSVAVLAWCTRSLHLDGLADTADGLASSADRGAALAVMRRGDVGPAGVVTLVVTIGLQGSLAGELVATAGGALGLALALAGARAALSMGCLRGISAARPDGLGATVAGSVSLGAALVQWAFVTGTLWLVTPGVLGAASLPVGLLGAGVLLVRVRRRLGGITGDVLGALVEVTATLALAVLALTH